MKVGDTPFGLVSCTLESVCGGSTVPAERLDFRRCLYTPVVRLQSYIPFYEQLRLFTLGAMELRIVKPSFKYTAGQWLFIMVPEISGWQWHPVSWGVAITYSPMLIQGSLPSHRLRKILMFPFTFAKSVTGRGLLVNVSVLAHKSSLP